MPTMKVTIENDVGVERELTLPAVYEVCGRCQGEGKHTNPSIDGNGITQEEFDEDPDFRENYFSGVYDIECEECHGKRVVAELDEKELEDRPRRRLGKLVTGKSRARILKRIHDRAQADADYRSLCRSEDRFFGYDR